MSWYHPKLQATQAPFSHTSQPSPQGFSGLGAGFCVGLAVGLGVGVGVGLGVGLGVGFTVGFGFGLVFSEIAIIIGMLFVFAVYI